MDDRLVTMQIEGRLLKRFKKIENEENPRDVQVSSKLWVMTIPGRGGLGGMGRNDGRIEDEKDGENDESQKELAAVRTVCSHIANMISGDESQKELAAVRTEENGFNSAISKQLI